MRCVLHGRAQPAMSWERAVGGCSPLTSSFGAGLPDMKSRTFRKCLSGFPLSLLRRCGPMTLCAHCCCKPKSELDVCLRLTPVLPAQDGINGSLTASLRAAVQFTDGRGHLSVGHARRLSWTMASITKSTDMLLQRLPRHNNTSISKRTSGQLIGQSVVMFLPHVFQH